MDPVKETEKKAEIKAFETSLSPAEKTVHELAKKMLKTRYNPVQCNLFRKKNKT
jgi:hypothetical protein